MLYGNGKDNSFLHYFFGWPWHVEQGSNLFFSFGVFDGTEILFFNQAYSWKLCESTRIIQHNLVLPVLSRGMGQQANKGIIANL